MFYSEHRVVSSQVFCGSISFPPFVHSPSGAPRNLKGGERKLLLFPFRCLCEVHKVLSASERREQYRQAVLTLKTFHYGFACLRALPEFNGRKEGDPPLQSMILDRY